VSSDPIIITSREGIRASVRLCTPTMKAKLAAHVGAVFAREPINKSCGIGSTEMEAFCLDVLEHSLHEELTVVAELLPSEEPVAFCVQMSFPHPPTDLASLPACYSKLAPVLSFLDGCDQALLVQSGVQALPGTRPILELENVWFHGLGDWAAPFLEACRAAEKGRARVVHLLMGGCKAGAEYRGLTRGVTGEGLRQAWSAGMRFSVAQTTSSASTAIMLGWGARIAMTIPYSAAGRGSPVAEVRAGRRAAVCRVVVVNLDELAVREKWDESSRSSSQNLGRSM
jgi:hypothetical protein